jgi:hypothetical protein
MADSGSLFRRAVKRVVPKFILDARRRRLLVDSIRKVDQDLNGRPTSEIFSEIYRRQLWGRPVSNRQFSSGHGSFMDIHVAPYVEAIGRFVDGLSWTPSVVDLGCGDFNVGSQIRKHFGEYIACDIAREVLQDNKIRFSDLGVEFRQIDMIKDELPEAEVCIIRQVLQHLSNADIARIVQKLGDFRILIVSENLPRTEFTPNIDQPTGVSSRVARGIPSGVVLTEPPFSLRVKSSQVLCATMDDFSFARLVTTAYWLK